MIVVDVKAGIYSLESDVYNCILSNVRIGDVSLF